MASFDQEQVDSILQSARLARAMQNTDHTQKKCIHVKFTMPDCMLGCAAEQLETILDRVWAQFGTAKTHYPDTGCCFLTFGSHGEAQAAINALNDPARFMANAEKVLQQVGSELRPEVAAATTQAGLQNGITFVKVVNILGFDVLPTGRVAVTATWANSRGVD
ncbi:hypothetical protein B484DRAFT_442637 [Ochromonadaceae sp. CCMP2298]|nr:hypothetical protein B484DRAFT_442637 [Ochromonadaceae sp. CCMP2298]